MEIEVDTLKIEQDARAEFQRSPELRAEFSDVENLIAYRVATARGQVRMAPGRVTKERT